MQDLPHRRGTFRLAGFEGSALILRTAVYPGADEETGEPALGLGIDIGLLSTTQYRSFLLREMDEAFSAHLAWFLRMCAVEWTPESNVPTYKDEPSGLECAVVSSTEAAVQLVWRIFDPDDDEALAVELPMRTSRSALLMASLEICLLQPAVLGV